MVMLLLAMGIIMFFILYQRKIIRHQLELKSINEQNQLQLTQAAIDGEEEERRRIASELHDDVGATLSSIRLFLHKADTKPELLTDSRQLLDETIQKVRNLSHQLQPDVLNRLGLQSALESYTGTMLKTGAINIQYNPIESLPRLDGKIELSVYRIVQELVNNILKHSRSTFVTIDTTVADGNLKLTLKHDGEGLTDETFNQLLYKKGSIGLKNIVNRVTSINADITFAQNAGGEYSVNCLVPIN